MSELHQQAISYVYLQVLQKLQCHYSHRQRLALEELIRRIAHAAGGHSRLNGFKVMLMHTGSRDSTQAVAFLRAAQLSLPLRGGQTFDLRIVTPRLSAPSPMAIGNLKRLYGALFVTDDPRVELLVADDRRAVLDVGQTIDADPMRVAQRRNLLVAAHLTGGDVRATLCHFDHRRVQGALRRGCNWKGGVGAWVQIDPTVRHEQYAGWTRQLASNAEQLRQLPPGQADDTLQRSLELLLDSLNQKPLRPMKPRHLVIDDLMTEILAPPSLALLEFLGYRLNDLSSAVHETEHALPCLMAHINGLRAEALTLLDYRDGVEHYLALAEPLLRGRQFPEPLLREGLEGYADEQRMLGHRQYANGLMRQRYGLREPQVLCLLFAPFVDRGAGLKRFLKRCHPRLSLDLATLHGVLAGEDDLEPAVGWLTGISGLSIETLRTLYGLGRIHVDDDHTSLARSRSWPTNARGFRGLHPVTGLPCVQPVEPADE